MSILYTIGDDSLYVNATNKCPCKCVFCIRNNGDTVGDSDNMWFEKDPTYEEIIAAFLSRDLSQYKEVVFCGYGEPLCALDTVLSVCDYLKENTNLPIRINTNGLSDLIHKKRTAPLLKGRVDCVSISLNAPNAKDYQAVTRSAFGEASFDAMLAFAKDAKQFVPKVMFTVVDVIGEAQIAASKEVAASVGIPLRVRAYVENNYEQE